MSSRPKDHLDRAARILRRTDRARNAALKIISHALSDMAAKPDQVKADAQIPKKDAPMYLHMATQLGASMITKEASKDEGSKTTLNVIITGQAPSNEAWLEAVRESQRPKAIDAVAKKVEKPDAG